MADSGQSQTYPLMMLPVPYSSHFTDQCPLSYQADKLKDIVMYV